MSSDIVIGAEGLGKKYVIGHRSADRHATLRETLGRTAGRLGHGVRDMLRGRPIVAGDQIEEFWALQDVSFEIRRGDVVGVIGRNGAGKSTLLKILSRITEPSTGRVEIKGRVASLLEVGTGFHPELTGRENIYLNGAILGMSRAEVRRKFDEIVDFAGVEKFLDTPVKRYSSGMYVRLAFSVAAHLEPEILVVDEVLSVGDAEFQKKCLGKMENVAGEGRTVLFVSHNLASVQRLCKSGIVLSEGRIDFGGTAEACVTRYLSATLVDGTDNVFSFPDQGPDEFHFREIRLEGDGERRSEIRTGGKASVLVSFHSPEDIKSISLMVNLLDDNLELLQRSLTDPEYGLRMTAKKGLNVFECTYESFPLTAGQFALSASLTIPKVRWLAHSPPVRIAVQENDVFGSGSPPTARHAPVYTKYSWRQVDRAPA
jgi:lipopolysaccharide transport system ATP-binding protein